MRCLYHHRLLAVPLKARLCRARRREGGICTFHQGISHSTELTRLCQDIREGRLDNDQECIEEVSHKLVSLLSQGSLNSKDLGGVVKVLQVFNVHSACYNQEFLDSLSDVLIRTSNEDVLCTILPPFLSLCKSLRYYNPSLMSHAGRYISDNVGLFSTANLGSLIHSYARLNHHIPGLVLGMERWLLDSQPGFIQSHVLWNLAWAGMVFSEHPVRVLARILTDDYIQGCNLQSDSILIILLQLKISLNAERLKSGSQIHDTSALKGLGLGLDNPNDLKQWGMCRSGLKGVSNRTLRKSYMTKLHLYYNRGRSTFGLKVHTALNSALGGDHFVQFDALALCGYTLDFEVLFGNDGRPAAVPALWKHRSSQTLAESIGEVDASRRKLKEGRKSVVETTELVQSMKSVEEMSPQVEEKAGEGDRVRNTMKDKEPEGKGEGVTFPLPQNGENISLVNLASDWGSKFCKVPSHVCRKVVVEANGPTHYARNCDHPLGHTVLKTKHLQYLGWQVHNVNYRHWMHLKTQEEKAQFICSVLM